MLGVVLAATDYWDPTRAANAGAAFAGVFTAIVLIVGAELAIRGSRRETGAVSPGHERDVLVTTVMAIVLLATATYLYVLLSGEPARSEMPGLIEYLTGQAAVAEQLNLRSVDIPTVLGLVQSSVRLFAIAGSTLAVGIVLSAFVVVFLVLNVSRGNPVGQTVLGLYLVGLLILAIFLLWGYHDAAKPFQGAGVLSDRLWWPAHALVFLSPVPWVWLSKCRLGAFVSAAGSKTRAGTAVMAGAALWLVLPVAAYLSLSGADPDVININVVTLAAAAWSSVALALLGGWAVAEIRADLCRGWTAEAIREAVLKATDGQRKVLAVIARNAGISPHEIAAELKLSSAQAVNMRLGAWSKSVTCPMGITDPRTGAASRPIELGEKKNGYETYVIPQEAAAVVIAALSTNP